MTKKEIIELVKDTMTESYHHTESLQRQREHLRKILAALEPTPKKKVKK